jgi:hypothetical protein
MFILLQTKSAVLNEGFNLIRQQHDLFTVSLRTALIVSCFAPGFVVRLKNWRQPVEADCEAIKAPMPGGLQQLFSEIERTTCPRIDVYEAGG